MEKGNTISTYLNKLTTYIDELGSVGITIVDDDMVSLAILGLPKSWNSYQDSVNGSEKLLDTERLWSDPMQDEIRRSIRDGSSSKNDDEENLALANKARKGKGKASHLKSKSSHGGKKGDMSKVRCFNCHEMGHYATNCPSKKSKKGSSEGSGASFHMTNDKNLFSALEEKDLKMRIEMGDDRRYSVSGVGAVAFQREHGAPLTLTNVMYVPGLKKNLVLITMLEDKCYDVIFSKRKGVPKTHIATGQTKRIGIQMKNLYKLEVDDSAALSTKAELVQSQDIGKLWHR
eukprot:PITA_27414